MLMKAWSAQLTPTSRISARRLNLNPRSRGTSKRSLALATVCGRSAKRFHEPNVGSLELGLYCGDAIVGFRRCRAGLYWRERRVSTLHFFLRGHANLRRAGAVLSENRKLERSRSTFYHV